MDADYRNMARHVDRVWTDDLELYSAADAVEDLLAHPGWHAVQAVLQTDLVEIDAMLDHGREPLSQAQYALAHGRRGGLRAAVEAALAIGARATKRQAEAEHHARAAEPA